MEQNLYNDGLCKMLFYGFQVKLTACVKMQVSVLGPGYIMDD